MHLVLIRIFKIYRKFFSSLFEGSLEILILSRVKPLIIKKKQEKKTITPNYQFGFPTAHLTIQQCYRVIGGISSALKKWQI